MPCNACLSVWPGRCLDSSCCRSHSICRFRLRISTGRKDASRPEGVICRLIPTHPSMASCPRLADGCGLREMRMDQIKQRPERHDLRTAFARAGERSFCGFAFNPEEPLQRFTIEILVDGVCVR